MRVALDLVKSGEAQACVSSGNTGALFFMAHYVLKMLPGVKRPRINIRPFLQSEKIQFICLI